MLSKFRFLHSSLRHLCPLLSSSSLPAILCCLKATMTVGLPGHTMAASVAVVSIQPPLSLSQASPQSPSRPKLAHGRSSSSSGPHDKHGQRKNRKAKIKIKDTDSHTSSGEDSVRHSSDSESSSSGYRMHWSHRSQHRTDSNGHKETRRSGGRGVTQGKRVVSSSESDVSDSEASRLKAMWCKTRLQAHSSLALIFQVSLLPSMTLAIRLMFSHSCIGEAVGSPHLLFLLVVVPPRWPTPSQLSCCSPHLYFEGLFPQGEADIILLHFPISCVHLFIQTDYILCSLSSSF